MYRQISQIIISLTIFISVSFPTSASTWLNNWDFRQRVSIQGEVGSEQDYQVLIKVAESTPQIGSDIALDSKAQDFPNGTNHSGDIRFASQNGDLLDFWVEKVDGVAPNRLAYIWVEVADDLDTDSDIFCYYSSGDNSNVSNLSDTFYEIIDNDNPLVGSWSFEQEVLGVTFDNSGNNNHASLINNPQSINSRFNNGYKFNGSNNLLINNHTSLNPTAQITLSAWVKWDINPSTGNGWASIINKNVDSQYRLQHNHNNSFFEFAIRTTSGARWVHSTTTPVQGNWYYVVGVYDGSSLYMYVNGVLEGTTNWTGNILTSVNPLAIGSRSIGDRNFVGDIDEVNIFNKALSTQQIEKMANYLLYSTSSNPNQILLRKYNNPEPTISDSSEQFYLSYNSGGFGNIVGDEFQIVDKDFDGTAVEAVPNSGYVFVKWSDNVVDNPRTDIDIEDHVEVSAIWAIQKKSSSKKRPIIGENFSLVQENYDSNTKTIYLRINDVYHVSKIAVSDNPQFSNSFLQDINNIVGFQVGDLFATKLYVMFFSSSGLSSDTFIVDVSRDLSILDIDNCVFEQQLYQGMISDDVRRLQSLLNSVGYLVSENGFGSVGLETEYFGPLTLRALTKYQSENSLEVTGVFDSKTIDHIGCSVKIKDDKLGNEVLLSRGMKNSKVKELQQRLNEVGFSLATRGPGSPTNETEYFGELTFRALKNFQNSKNLTVTGVLDSQTYALLFE
jgi:peptidoglycan hydrolase-like protein with peptidoglycan-binding domain